VRTIDLDALRKELGDDEIVAEIATVFLQDLPERLDALTRALAAGDLVTATREAHSIKGAARNFGMDRLSAACADLEAAAKRGDGAAAKTAFPAIEATAGEAAAALKTALAKAA